MYAALDNITQSLNNEGYTITDPWDVVEAFEDKTAQYAVSQYALTTDLSIIHI